MRIVQIIDSLEVGGAERMAINYANALSKENEFSGLVATRKEGNQKSYISNEVSYLFLDRKKTLDFKAIFKLRAYCKKNKVEFLHAHSTSYFLSVMVKCVYPKVKIVWHDHNGMSEFLSSRESWPLKFASFLFAGIIVVNNQLKVWAESELNCKKVIYIPNFTNQESTTQKVTFLKGTIGKRILCLANLRYQKNHFFLLKVAQQLKQTQSDWTFHLVGKDFFDDYSERVKEKIISKKLENNVFLYGSRNDIGAIIDQCDIGILTSESEGLPVALLEYGLHKKPTVVTDVGEIPLIIQNNKNGFIVSSKNEKQFYKSLERLIEDKELRDRLGDALYRTINENNSEIAVIQQYSDWIKNI